MLGFVCGQRLAIIQTAQAAASSPQISNAPTPPAPSQGTPRTSPTPQPGQQPPPPAAAPRLQAGVPQPNAVVVQLGAYATLSDAYLALARLQADQHERYEAARAELNQVWRADSGLQKAFARGMRKGSVTCHTRARGVPERVWGHGYARIRLWGTCRSCGPSLCLRATLHLQHPPLPRTPPPSQCHLFTFAATLLRH